MCNPASLVVTKEEVYWSTHTESHEEIIAEFKLRPEVGGKTMLMRIECRPPEGKWDSDTETWSINKDQDIAPDWWDVEAATPRIRAALVAWRKAKVVMPGETRTVRGQQIIAAMANSSVEARENSSVVAWENSSVEARGNSSVEARGNSRVVARGNSSVEARGNSSVEARGNSSVVAWGNSVKCDLKDSAVKIDRSGPGVKVYIGDGRCIE